MKTTLTLRPLFLGLAAIAFAGASAHAATIALYDFTGGSFASNDPSTSWTTTDLGSGGGVPLATDGSEGQPAPSLAFSMGDINDGTFLDNDYYTFTIDPSVSLNFSTFSFDINKLSGGADVNYQVFSSVDGFTSGNELGSGAISATGTWSDESIDISSLSSISTATEFRIYLETGGTFDPNGIRIDNILVEGDVIPEPSAVLLGGIGALFLLRRRR